jgi:ATP-dependent DNA helicase RecQ
MENGVAYHLLKTYFGYTTFLPHQEKIIENIMADRDVLAIIATGGGKSLCYQLPALLKKGVSVVVSPLIALMKDQVDSLRENGIEAAYLNSTLEYAERKEIEDALLRGRIRILYASPEKMVQPGFLAFLRTISLSLIAVDEAHCISHWGHEFRPEYRRLGILKKEFPGIPIIALTATATPPVQNDIIAQLHLQNPYVETGSFYRKNLAYQVWEKKNGYAQIVSYLRKHPRRSGIIYCMSKKTVDELARKLNRDGFRALPYHAGLPKPERSRAQERFISDDVEIMVATIAFGMGIDKPDVRFVIHHDLPKNLEYYYQETGRAGRDGEQSDCILLYSRGDRGKIRFFIDQLESESERKISTRKLHDMIDFCESRTCRVRKLLNYFGEEYPYQSCGACDNCKHPREVFDATGIAQMAITCISQLRSSFGIGYITDVLRGSKGRKVRERGDTKIPAWGSGRDCSREEWHRYLRELVQLGYLSLEGEQYPVVTLNDRSRRVMSGGETVYLTKATPRQTSPTTGRSAFNSRLYERMRRLRKQLADAEGIPPYMVFSDSTLREMASRKPQTKTSLRQITGVGDYKLTKFGDAFIVEIRGYLPETPVKQESARGGQTSLQKTRDLYMQGLTLREIATERDLTEETIGGHIEELILSGEDIALDDLVIPEKQDTIRSLLATYNDENLKMLKDRLGERYSYNDIRFVRAFLKREKTGSAPN